MSQKSASQSESVTARRDDLLEDKEAHVVPLPDFVQLDDVRVILSRKTDGSVRRRA